MQNFFQIYYCIENFSSTHTSNAMKQRFFQFFFGLFLITDQKLLGLPTPNWAWLITTLEGGGSCPDGLVMAWWQHIPHEWQRCKCANINVCLYALTPPKLIRVKTSNLAWLITTWGECHKGLMTLPWCHNQVFFQKLHLPKSQFFYNLLLSEAHELFVDWYWSVLRFC